ncbi:MAG: hypothetical protein ACE5GW_02410, partial [Planctomycetota bacterium]
GDRHQMNEELGKLTTEETEAREKIAQIPELQRRSKDLANIIEEYTAILPREDEVRLDAFLEDVSHFCEDLQIMILNAHPLDIKKKRARAMVPTAPGAKAKQIDRRNNFVRHKYQFDLVGTFPALHSFINRVENHKRFLQIDGIDVRPFGSGEREKMDEELALAENPHKVMSVRISTYTYSKVPESEEAR